MEVKDSMASEDEEVKDEYLGDGVYASHDGYHVWLDLRGQDNTTRIALEPPVCKRLIAYINNAHAVARARGEA